LVSHAYYVGSGLRYAEVTRANKEDVHYSGAHHLFHSGGQQLGVVGPMFVGMQSHMEKWFSASSYWERARAVGATIIDPIGPVIAALLRQSPTANDAQEEIRLGVGAATGQIPPEMRDAFETRFGVLLLEVYAQTETGGVLMCSQRIDDHRKGSAGVANGWAEIAIVDPDDQFVRPGEQGEIVVRPLLPNTFMIEYINKPIETLSSWRNLWHHTGDLGYLDEDGYLYFVGRQAHWMRRRGENVSSYEVEYCALTMEGVVECAVVGIRDEEMGDEEIKIYVVRDGTCRLTEADVVAWCSERLAYFKVPRFVEFVAELPRSGAKNEIERHKLREMGKGDSWDARAAGVSSVPPPRNHETVASE
jgi:crotonobetaine/carnitine-CoA ligase